MKAPIRDACRKPSMQTREHSANPSEAEGSDLRLKDLLGPVTRVKKKEKKRVGLKGRTNCFTVSRSGSGKVSYLRLVGFCITHL